jgi:hypothetical protein
MSPRSLGQPPCSILQPAQLLVVQDHFWSGFADVFKRVIQRHSRVDEKSHHHRAGPAEAAAAMDVEASAFVIRDIPGRDFQQLFESRRASVWYGHLPAGDLHLPKPFHAWNLFLSQVDDVGYAGLAEPLVFFWWEGATN